MIGYAIFLKTIESPINFSYCRQKRNYFPNLFCGKRLMKTPLSDSFKRKLLGGCVIGALLLSLSLLMVGMEHMTFKEGDFLRFFSWDFSFFEMGTMGAQGPVPTLSDTFFLIILAFLVVALVLFPFYWKRVLRAALSVIAFFLIIELLAKTSFRGLFSQLGSDSDEPADPNLLANMVDQIRIEPSDSVVFLISSFMVFGVMAGAYAMWRTQLRLKPEEETLPVKKLEHQAQAALDQIYSGKNVKNTIVRCYEEMSDILAQSQNITRNHVMTPREFEQALLKYDLPQEPIQALTRLFEQVRYGQKETGLEEEEQCTECLSAVIQACRSSHEKTNLSS